MEGGSGVASPQEVRRGPRTPRPASASMRRPRGAENRIRPLALLVIAGVVGWFVTYAMKSSGASRVNAFLAAGLVVMGSLLFGWSHVRQRAQGGGDDPLDRLLTGAGQALLLGAVLTFGFGIVGQHDDERADRDLKRDGEGVSSLDRQNLALAVRGAAGGNDYRRSDLASQNLSGLDMHGFNLSGADLTYANLTDVDLSGADLSGAHLRFTDLSGADLYRANLADAHLANANLHDAFMAGADLDDANLSGANLTGAILRQAHLSGADLDGVNLTGAHLTSADLDDVHHGATTVWPGGFQPPPGGPGPGPSSLESSRPHHQVPPSR